ncbi:MAG: hypothetical protein K0V04_24585, partial [Deltaproteobacteria bacterium]|nr:hypothetical protein [Deltaproteobacteria bacterium]
LGAIPRRVRRWQARRRQPVRPSAASEQSPDASTERSAPSSAAQSAVGAAADVVHTDGRGGAYWGLMAAAGLLVSALGYATQWAEPNAFIPGVVLGALALAVVLPVGGRVQEPIALALVGAQLLFSLLVEPRYQPVQTKGWAGLSTSYTWQDPGRTFPSGQAWDHARELRAQLEASEGETFALHRPWWSVLAGGTGHVGSMGVTDVLPEDRAAIQGSIREALRARRYARVWLEGEPPRWMSRDLLSGYRVEQRRHGAQRVRPWSGYMSDAGMVSRYRRDQLSFVPRGPRVAPPGTSIVADFESLTLEGFTKQGPAFARPQRGTPRRLPPAGPYGGDALLTSAGGSGRLNLQGSADSPVISLPQAGHVEMLVGFGGRNAKGLTVEIVEEGTDRTVRLDVPAVPHALAPVRWRIEPDWVGAQIRIRLGDTNPEAALYFDDLWVVTQASKD